MQSAPWCEEDIYLRFRYSYGAWSVLAMMLGPLEFVQMQALCQYTYKTSISRV